MLLMFEIYKIDGFTFFKWIKSVKTAAGLTSFFCKEFFRKKSTSQTKLFFNLKTFVKVNS